MSISTTTKAAMIINDYIWLPSCLVLIVLTVSSVAIAAGSNHHRYHLPYTHSNAQIGTLSSTPSPSTMLPHPFHSPSSFHSMANYSGDIMLGAIFPIHERDANFSCGSLQAESVQQMEALVYSLSRINADPNILRGIKLGVLIIDSCDSPHHALEQTIDFIKSFVARRNLRLKEPEFQCADHTPPVYKFGQFDRVLGIIGGQSSEVSLQLANLLRLFQVPQVSYMSTSPTLSDKRLYEYFFRTVPSDTNQVDAIVEILKLFRWTYVSVVYSDTDYGNNGYNLLSTAAARNNICISSPQAIDVERFGPADYDNLITTLMHKINARVVVVFTDRVIARKLMEAAKLRLGNGRMDRFVWIASDAWCCREFVVRGLEDVVEGSISVTPMSYPLTGFGEYFRSLRPEHNQNNPWFVEFWQQHFKCIMPNLYQTLYGNKSTSDIHQQPQTLICNESMNLSDEIDKRASPSLHFVRDSLYSFAMAFDGMHREYCNGTPGICELLNNKLYDGAELSRWLLQVQFKDEGNKLFRFNNGDAPPRYRVVNYQQMPDGVYQWRPVGTYMLSIDEFNQSSEAQLNLNMSALRFKSYLNQEFPRSFCSEPCGPGQAKLQLEGDTCCWLCTNCSQYQYLPDEFHCANCPIGTEPDSSKTSCIPLTPIYPAMNDWWTISNMIFSVLGMIATISTFIVFCAFFETPIIKAAGRELSHLHLAGIFMSFAMTFVIISKPSSLVCGLTRFFLGFCYTVCYSAIVTKTNRIARIFRHRSCKPPPFTSPRSQLVITSLLIGVEVFINLFWIFFDPPDTMFVYPARDKALLICSGSDRITYLLGLLYPLILIGFCTVYAFKTRKCPEGFNEARYITFTNYTTCVVWLAFLPLFVMLGTTTPLRYVTLCLLMSVSGTVQLCCLFVPKMYIALLKPEKNTRESVMCGSHYSRSLNCTSATNSTSTIARRQTKLNGTQTPVTGDHYSTSSEETTSTRMALHHDKQHSKDSQVETTSVGGESSTGVADHTNHLSLAGGISVGNGHKRANSNRSLRHNSSNGKLHSSRSGDLTLEYYPKVNNVRQQVSVSISAPITSTITPPMSPLLSQTSATSLFDIIDTSIITTNRQISTSQIQQSSSSTSLSQKRSLMCTSISPTRSLSPLSAMTPSSMSIHSNGCLSSQHRTSTNTMVNSTSEQQGFLSTQANTLTTPTLLGEHSNFCSHSVSSPALTIVTNENEPLIKNNETNDNNNNNNNNETTTNGNSVPLYGDNKLFTKHETSAVLENGHERWPSVRLQLNANCATTNGESMRRH